MTNATLEALEHVYRILHEAGWDQPAGTEEHPDEGIAQREVREKEPDREKK